MRAANQLNDDVDMSEVKEQSFKYYQNAKAYIMNMYTKPNYRRIGKYLMICQDFAPCVIIMKNLLTLLNKCNIPLEKDYGLVHYTTKDQGDETIVYLHFLNDNGTTDMTDVTMWQPYGENGIWIPK